MESLAGLLRTSCCFFFFFFITLSHQTCMANSAGQANSTDLDALLTFKAQIDIHGVLTGSWNTTTHFCNWAGVTCGSRKHRERVTALELAGMSLRGTIAPVIGNLSFLSTLVLNNNSLTGVIPAGLGALRRLRFLYLNGNNLVGPVPASVGLGNLTNLVVLNLSDNLLSGGIPGDIDQLPKLQELHLHNNSLSGTIPVSLFNKSSMLIVLNLGNNSLAGEIPESVGRLKQLKALDIQYNQLSGQIPVVIFNLSKLEYLNLRDNNLSGSIPDNQSFSLQRLQTIILPHNMITGTIISFSRSPELQILNLIYNHLAGPVPPELGGLGKLEILTLGENLLNGLIPAELGNLTHLKVLDISSCNLTGEIPPELGGLKDLQWLNLEKNNLGGTIPDSLGNATALQTLALGYNDLGGPAPSSIGNLELLETLYLQKNALTGDIAELITAVTRCRRLQVILISDNCIQGNLPDSIGNLSRSLQHLSIGSNSIEGMIPAALGKLNSLIAIWMGNNRLSGTIPDEIEGLKMLQLLDLNSNYLEGALPAVMGELSSLSQLDLHRNLISGPIPKSIGNINGLQILTLTLNNITSPIPESLWGLHNLILLNLSSNKLEGFLPPQVGNLKAIEGFDLSNNLLSGPLPNTFGSLQMLQLLNLSQNSFKGPIPQSIGELINIEYLDLSSNSLSGNIPESIENLRYLSSLNLSFNKLNGEIPSGGIFSNLTNQSLMGNARLCGDSSMGFPPCTNGDKGLVASFKSKLWILNYVLPISAYIVIAAACVHVVRTYKMTSKINVSTGDEDDDSNVCVKQGWISYQELARATNNFSDDAMLGNGTLGWVFKGKLDDGSVVAVKVLNTEIESASKSFANECRGLNMVKHRNIVKIIGMSSTPKFRALVLEYMPNGSLDRCLHNNPAGYRLSMIRRINIVLEIALALEYLHHHLCHLVLHCDLKPSNVLLDENMSAHLADFGAAKLLSACGGSSFAYSYRAAVGTFGYMAPEYGMTGKASRWTDIYSYGILVLEVFTRKRPIDPMFDGETSLRRWVDEAFPDQIWEIVDSMLLQDCGCGRKRDRVVFEDKVTSDDLASRRNCLMEIVKLGLQCSRDLPKERILMKEVVVRLKKMKEDYLCGSPVRESCVCYSSLGPYT